ncbi:MAG: metallophosphoesterase family protein [Acidimicrobiales bacterium]
MEIRFLHSSDWQLGMTRHFLGPEAQARYTDDQFALVRRLGQLASDQRSHFVVVAGDVFDHLLPDRRIIARAVDALESFAVPVYLLPGNHDADNPAALWSNTDIIKRLPSNVQVLRDSVPVPVPGADVEIVGVPLLSRKPDRDLVNEVLAGLEPAPEETVRVVVAHGQVEGVAFNGPDEPVLISRSGLEAAVADRRASYVALGDRHSVTSVGASEAIWYSGAPQATDFREDDPNKVLVVAIADRGITVEPVEVGEWRFIVREFELTGSGELERLEGFLTGLDEKERTVVKLGITGTVNLSVSTRLEKILDDARDLLGGLEVSSRRSELVVIADEADLADLDLSGFARSALDELAEQAASDGEGSTTARDALMLLHRLAARTR